MFHLFKHFGHKPPPYIQFGGGLLLNGLLFILFGFAILAAPELLAFLVAIVLIFFGASLLVAWWKIKEAKKHWSRDL